jgi:hypothetical protein
VPTSCGVGVASEIQDTAIKVEKSEAEELAISN